MVLVVLLKGHRFASYGSCLESQTSLWLSFSQNWNFLIFNFFTYTPLGNLGHTNDCVAVWGKAVDQNTETDWNISLLSSRFLQKPPTSRVLLQNASQRPLQHQTATTWTRASRAWTHLIVAYRACLTLKANFQQPHHRHVSIHASTGETDTSHTCSVQSMIAALEGSNCETIVCCIWLNTWRSIPRLPWNEGLVHFSCTCAVSARLQMTSPGGVFQLEAERYFNIRNAEGSLIAVLYVILQATTREGRLKLGKGTL